MIVVYRLVPCCIVILGSAVGRWAWTRRSSKSDGTDYRAVVGLYVIRRRLEVAQLKTELRRDAAHQRRRLWADLRKLEERESRQP